ncbi:MAG: hypothetical protein ACFFAN_10970 [Promethearchaeota archaeon]
MIEKDKKDLWLEIPSYAWIALGRRGMEKISLDQCFLIGCDNQDAKLLEPIDMEEFDDEDKNLKIISIKCKKCGGIFKFKLETIKKVAKLKKESKDRKNDEEALSMGLVYALDENGKNLGHIGYF